MTQYHVLPAMGNRLKDICNSAHEIENGISRLVHVNKKHGLTREEAKEDLMEQYLLDSDAAIAKVVLYW